MSPILVTPSVTPLDPQLYPCPVFRTSQRSGNDNLALILHLPIDGVVSDWVEMGVALTIEKRVNCQYYYFLNHCCHPRLKICKKKCSNIPCSMNGNKSAIPLHKVNKSISTKNGYFGDIRM